ncbi:MAG: toll/interleukin-1 receptor domain-containing protein [Pseudomonadota bacterium]
MRVFLSYRRADAEAEARSIEQRLLMMPDIKKVFLDHETIPTGENFVLSIQKAIKQAGVVLVLIGQDWRGVNSDTGAVRLMDPKDFVRLEIAEAIKAGRQVIPVLLNDTPMPRPDELPAELRPLTLINAARVRMEEFEEDIDKLLDGIFGTRPRISRWQIPRMTAFRALRLMVYGLALAIVFLVLLGVINQQVTGGGTLHLLLRDWLGSETDPDIGFLWLLVHLVLDVAIIGAMAPFFYRLLKQRRSRRGT